MTRYLKRKHLWSDGDENIIIYDRIAHWGMDSCSGGRDTDGSVGVWFSSASPQTYASRPTLVVVQRVGLVSLVGHRAREISKRQSSTGFGERYCIVRRILCED